MNIKPMATMTKQHFDAIARTIRHNNEMMCTTQVERDALLDVALNLSATLSEFNPRFNVDKFIKACGF